MITAVDTSVLLDVFGPDPAFGPASKSAIDSSLAEGQLVACEVVWAEIAGFFPDAEAARHAMERLGVEFAAVDVASALRAGSAWRAYRQRGGRRERVVADFLVASHALARADRLLTRDRGFYRAYFRQLRLVDPSRN